MTPPCSLCTFTHVTDVEQRCIGHIFVQITTVHSKKKKKKKVKFLPLYIVNREMVFFSFLLPSHSPLILHCPLFYIFSFLSLSSWLFLLCVTTLEGVSFCPFTGLRSHTPRLSILPCNSPSEQHCFPLFLHPSLTLLFIGNIS